MLTIQKLTKQFGSITAVDNVQFDIQRGEIFSLIGPNGSGKTTIIKIIAGLLQPTQGTITINNFDVTQQPVEAKGVTGYIPDEPAVWPGITGEEFLHFTGALYGLNEHVRTERISALLSQFNLQGIGKRYFEDYSRGNKQKFTIAAALLHRPKLLLIDEPIVGLDPTSATIAKKLFRTFTQEGGAILLATHTLSVAQEISTRIAFLQKGSIVTAGTFEELRDHAGLSPDSSLDALYDTLRQRT